MAQLIGDLSKSSLGCATLHPQNITGNTAGGSVATATVGGDIFTMWVDVGSVNTLTSVVVTAECSADGQTGWTPCSGVGGTTPNVTITAANTTGMVAFYPGNGSVSQYVRGNAVLTGTSANITAGIFGQVRIGTSAGYQNTPPSGST